MPSLAFAPGTCSCPAHTFHPTATPERRRVGDKALGRDFIQETLVSSRHRPDRVRCDAYCSVEKAYKRTPSAHRATSSQPSLLGALPALHCLSGSSLSVCLDLAEGVRLCTLRVFPAVVCHSWLHRPQQSSAGRAVAETGRGLAPPGDAQAWGQAQCVPS